MKSVIARSESVVAIEQDFGGDIVFITFNEMAELTRGDRFWGDEFFASRQISSIGVMTSEPNWYPPGEMVEIIAKIRERIAGRKVVTYGFSMGAYGALKFGRALGANIALAFSPQWSIRPQDLGDGDRRYVQYYDDKRDNGARITRDELPENCFIFHDPTDQVDVLHLNKIAALKTVYPVISRFSLHETVRIVTEGRGADRMVEICRSAITPSSRLQFRQMVRQSRRGSGVYQALYNAYIFKNSEKFSRHFDGILDGLSEVEKNIYLAMRYFRSNPELSNSYLDKINIADCKPLNLVPLWNRCREAGFAALEGKIADALIAHHSDDVWLCLYAVNTYATAGDRERAVAELERLISRPDAPRHVSHIYERAQQINRLDLLDRIWVDMPDGDEKRRIGFVLIDSYSTGGMSGKITKILDGMIFLCADDPQGLRRIADHYLRIRILVPAINLYEKLLQISPDDEEVRLGLVEATMISEGRHDKIPKETMKYLKSLVENTDDTGKIHRAIEIFNFRKHNKEVVWAMKRAAIMSDYRQDCLFQYTERLLLDKKPILARLYLYKALHAKNIDGHHYRRFSETTLKFLPKSKFSLRFARLQYNADKHGIRASIFLIRALYQVGLAQEARQMVTTLLESRKAELSPQQWNELGEVVFAVDIGPLAKAIATEIAARDPNNYVARNIIETKYALGFLN